MKAKEELVLEGVLPSHAEHLVRCILGHYLVERSSYDYVMHLHCHTIDHLKFSDINDSLNFQ